MLEFQVGDKVKFREGARVPFRIHPGAKLTVRQLSSSGAVLISIEQAGSVWVKGELLEPADDAVSKKQEEAR